MISELVVDNECRPARFHMIINFLANKIYDFKRLPHQKG